MSITLWTVALRPQSSTLLRLQGSTTLRSAASRPQSSAPTRPRSRTTSRSTTSRPQRSATSRSAILRTRRFTAASRPGSTRFYIFSLLPANPRTRPYLVAALSILGAGVCDGTAARPYRGAAASILCHRHGRTTDRICVSPLDLAIASRSRRGPCADANRKPTQEQSMQR